MSLNSLTHINHILIHSPTEIISNLTSLAVNSKGNLKNFEMWTVTLYPGSPLGSWRSRLVPDLSVWSGFCRVIWFCRVICWLPWYPIVVCYIIGIAHCTFFMIKHRTCHSALHLLLIHAFMRYFYTIILFLSHTW